MNTRESKHVSKSLHLALVVWCLVTAGSLAAAEELTWRELDPENTVFMELGNELVVIELNPVFAPATVKQFKRLAQEHFYEGLSFYRVIDGFVAQGGDGSDLGELSNVPLIEAEFEIEWDKELPFMPVQSPDMFAPETGLSNGFGVARDKSKNKAWLAHCPGVVALARNDDPDSSRTDFYIVIGQAPRYLDRNMNIFGRVVYGMDVVQSINRGPVLNNGIIDDDTGRTRISKLRMLNDIPEDDRLSTYVMNTHNEAFADLLKDRRNRKQKFFHNKPPAVLDVCQVPVAGRITK
jgi:peptidylprolyl isomerase